jgi:hypothetical protein
LTRSKAWASRGRSAAPSRSSAINDLH